MAVSIDWAERKERLKSGLHWCYACKKYNPVENYAKAKGKRFDLNNICKKCDKIRRRGDKKAKARMRDKARELISYYAALTGGECEKCGYDKSAAGLQFHHVDPSEKCHVISSLAVRNNHEETLAELDKCVLLCANCHSEYEADIWDCEFVKKNGIGWAIKPGSINVLRDNKPTLDISFKLKYTKPEKKFKRLLMATEQGLVI